jgi:hypothetical protein
VLGTRIWHHRCCANLSFDRSLCESPLYFLLADEVCSDNGREISIVVWGWHVKSFEDLVVSLDDALLDIVLQNPTHASHSS